MVNEEKVRLMTRVAFFEQEDCSKEIKEGGYYKTDYIRSHLLFVIWSYTMGYVLMIGLLVLYHLEYFMSKAVMADFRRMGLAIFAIYVLILFGCIFFSMFYYSQKYNRIAKMTKDYFDTLKELEQFYKQEKEGGNG